MPELKKSEKKAIVARMKKEGLYWKYYLFLNFCKKFSIFMLLFNAIHAYYGIGLYKYFFASVVSISIPVYTIFTMQKCQKEIISHFLKGELIMELSNRYALRNRFNED